MLNIAIPKTSYQYTYQLKTTPEIRNFEIQFKNLSQFATHFGWTLYTYREYLRIKTELREKCKEAHNKNWEDKIKYISENNENSKEFWNKTKMLQGKNSTYTNYMKDKDRNKLYSDKEKCNLMEQTWRHI